MTNEEIIQKTFEEIHLRGLSVHTKDEYLQCLRGFLRYYDNRRIHRELPT